MADLDRWRRPTRDMLIGLPCLTLWRPWPTYIFHPDVPVPKRVENRTWHPPQRIFGQMLGIHAGGALDHEVEFFSGRYTDERATPSMIEHAALRFALVGVARVAGSCEGPFVHPPKMPDQKRWWVGPVGWLLDSVVAFDEPIPMKGSQGVWRIDAARLDGAPKTPPPPDPQRPLFEVPRD